MNRGWALSIAMAVSACGGGGAIQGSLAEVYDFDFDRIDIRKIGLSLQIEYIQVVLGVDNKVLKIIVEGPELVPPNCQGVVLESGARIEEECFLQAVAFERVTGLDGTERLDVTSGRLHFGTLEFDTAGAASGTFDATVGGNRTISGPFNGRIDNVDVQ